MSNNPIYQVSKATGSCSGAVFDEMITEEELDGHREIFGWKFSDNVCEGNSLVSIYMEDDERWHLKMTFHIFWMNNFQYLVDALWSRTKEIQKGMNDE